MTSDEINDLLLFAIDLAKQLDVYVMIGVLKQDVPAMSDTIKALVSEIKQHTGMSETVLALKKARVCGFTVCPPTGADLSDLEIRNGLESILSLDVPVALYQLPQVTQNEISPETFHLLAKKYPLFYLLKDTSGNDLIARADKGKSHIFLVRGAEGHYEKWLKESGGPYDGLLLSTTNCFAPQLALIIEHLENKEYEHAKAISDQLTLVIEFVFKLVQDLKYGNPFTNANKAIDHYMAYGSDAIHVEPPLLYSGERLPKQIIDKTGDILQKADLIPQKGYLDKK